MQHQILSSDFVKPSTPTPLNLRSYTLSVIDELSPTMNVPLILYYYPNNSTNGGIISASLRLEQLKKSLEQTLTHFFPFAGRYNKDRNLIDCNDQGVEFLEAKVDNIHLLDFVTNQEEELKSGSLNCLIPREIGEVDEIGDPLLAIQVTMFECGGLAIGFCMSHRIGDAATLSMLINRWGDTCREGGDRIGGSPPIFNSASFFPGRNIRTGPMIPRTSNTKDDKPKISTRRFSFTGKSILALKEIAMFNKRNNKRQPSRVQLIIALIWKALMSGSIYRESFILQPVNVRSKTIPPLPKSSCGNLFVYAIARGESGMDFLDCVDQLGNAISNTLEDCTEMLSHGEDGQIVLMKSFIEAGKIAANSEVSTYGFSSWCRFPFNEADFGWGKPDWASSVKSPIKNVVTLMDDRKGDGIEAWVHLDDKDMISFEQDCDLRAFTT